MDFGFLVKRVSAILRRPREEWEIIKKEKTTIENLFARYAVILAAIPAAAQFVGFAIFGRPTLEGYVPVSAAENARWTIVSYALSLASVYLLAYFIDSLAPYFKAKKDLLAVMKVVVYSHTASWAASVFLVFPPLFLAAGLLSLYSLFLLYTGMKSLLGVPARRMTGYFAAAILASIVISLGGLLVGGVLLGSAA
ncbi:MAG: YIP1 family protein [Candidatus Aminicenantes bacterium]|nr:YIP1 family protein [Candidatus Aminicenantes bacterium]